MNDEAMIVQNRMDMYMDWKKDNVRERELAKRLEQIQKRMDRERYAKKTELFHT